MASCREERVERPAFHIGHHAAAVVHKENFDMIGSGLAQPDGDSSFTAVGECMCHRIEGEVGQSLPERPGIAIHRQI